MNFGIVRKLLGRIMTIVGLLMLFPLIFTIYYKESFKNYIAFIIPSVILIAVGVVASSIKNKSNLLTTKEGLFIAGISWIIMSLAGALPFVISGCIPNYIDAFFEISSGFSTTGSTILGDIESLRANYHSLLMWRSFSHWLGGMGVIVLILAIIPESSSGNAIQILRAESPGPQVGKLVSKMKASSRILYLIYILLTLLDFICLMIGPDFDVFDSLIHAFGTAGTGGFSTYNASFANMSLYTVSVTTIFMILFGVNFTLFYFMLIGNFKAVLKSEELKAYIGIIITSVLVIVLNLYFTFKDTVNALSISEYVKISFFQVAATMSTTGFGITDYSNWPVLSKFIIVALMIIGGCAGSTGGGFKLSRIIILFKTAINKIKHETNPNRVSTINFEGKPLNEEVSTGVVNYFVIYFIIFVLCTLLISLDGRCDLVTNLSASLTCLNNVGPGFNMINPTSNFGVTGANYSNFSKIILSLEMIAGRLELFPVLVIFNPRIYFKNL